MLKDDTNYKVFVSNRVTKIRESNYLVWKCVPTNKNPANVGSHGCLLRSLQEHWKTGPAWFETAKHWPKQPVLQISDESECEKKMIKGVLRLLVSIDDQFDNLLRKQSFGKFFSILGRISCFVKNSRRNRIRGPLTMEEVPKQNKKFN